jgi:hypothetical protein
MEAPGRARRRRHTAVAAAFARESPGDGCTGAACHAPEGADRRPQARAGGGAATNAAPGCTTARRRRATSRAITSMDRGCVRGWRFPAKISRETMKRGHMGLRARNRCWPGTTAAAGGASIARGAGRAPFLRVFPASVFSLPPAPSAAAAAVARATAAACRQRRCLSSSQVDEPCAEYEANLRQGTTALRQNELAEAVASLTRACSTERGRTCSVALSSLCTALIWSGDRDKAAALALGAVHRGVFADPQQRYPRRVRIARGARLRASEPKGNPHSRGARARTHTHTETLEQTAHLPG